MRIPAPDRLPWQYVILFTSALFVGQVLEGTDFLFAVLTAVYILLWALAFNISGGIRYPSGAFIFFNGFLNVVLGLAFKVFLGQPGERNLVAPNATMFVYCIGMTMLLGVAFVTRGLRPERGMLHTLDSPEEYKKAAIICLVVGFIIYTISLVARSNPIISILAQINKLPQLGVMLATSYEITRSNGKRSFNWIVTAGLIVLFLFGLFSFGKEGMLVGFVAYLVAAWLHNYDFPKIQIVVSIALALVFSYYLVPYSQYARGFKSTTISGNLAVAFGFLTDLNGTRRLYEATLEDFDLSIEPHLYDKREGFIDRLIVLPADDALIGYTNQGNVYGLTAAYAEFANVVPRFLWRNKPTINTGNAFGHELNELSEDDETTGIAFSATAVSYHEAKWLGILLLLPLTIFLYCIANDTVMGSAKWAPWAMVAVLDASHIAVEAGLTGPLYYATAEIFGMIVIYWIVRVGAPFVIQVIAPHKPQPLAVPDVRPVRSSAS